MQFKQLIQDIAEYAVKNEVVECAMGGLSLYEVNFKDNNNYPMLFISPSQNHNISNNTVTYNIMLYYIDRLLRDNENNIDIVNASVGKLQQIINIIKSFDDVLKVNNDYQINNFADTQRLTDNVAGGFVTLSITVQNTQGVCAIDAVLPTINVIKINYQNKDININENGDYNVTYDNGYNALKEVNINVNIDTDSYYNDGFNTGKIEGYNEGYEQGDINGREEQKSLLEAIKITENGVFDNENGYDEVTVEIDTQSYYDNGYNTGYNEGADAGYNNGYNEGYNNGEVNGIEQGKEEQKSLLTSINITENGNYTNENGYNEVIVNVGGDVKPKLPNGINLGNSTFTTIDMGRQDWSNVYDWSNMFWNCTNLTEIQNFPSNVEILSADNMFYHCDNLMEIPELNTSNCVNMGWMFCMCQEITSIPQIDTNNVLNMQEMFSYCNKLTSIPQIDTSNCMNMNTMFRGCSNLISIPQINTSNVTDTSFMFANCAKLESIPEIDFTNIVKSENMFNGCYNLIHNFNINAPNLTIANAMFFRCQKLTNINFSNTNNIKDASTMFRDCKNLEYVNGLNFENATNLRECFEQCNKLIYLDDLKTSNATDFYFIFDGCKSIKKVKINITKAENMQAMFGNCFNLEEIYFEGNPSYSNIFLRDTFYRAGENVDNPIMYYPQEFETNYQQIINVLPSKWTAVPY